MVEQSIEDPTHEGAARAIFAYNVAESARVYGEIFYENKKKFIPGETPISVSGAVRSAEDFKNGVMAVLNGWWTDGYWTRLFEGLLAKEVGVKFASFCNSGSSANLLAMAALKEVKKIPDGAEVITAACGFPTTLNPILQNKLTPVLVDVVVGTYVPTADIILEAITPKTRAIILAHTLGNPFPLIMDEAARKYLNEKGISIIEDNCDALGSKIKGVRTGGLGDIGTQSFYPAHHITTGEGGAVLTQSKHINRVINSYRDWGRDCYCKPGCDNTCGKRFECKFPLLPDGYDHKYVYSRIGYNLKATEMQAAIGVSQIRKLDEFTKTRRRNFDRLFAGLSDTDYLIMPRATLDSEPSWFGFPMTVRDCGLFDRSEIVAHLEKHKIATRNLFGGNFLMQPAYAGENIEAYGSLKTSDGIAEKTFWIGCWHGLTDEMIDYVIEVIQEFIHVKERMSKHVR